MGVQQTLKPEKVSIIRGGLYRLLAITLIQPPCEKVLSAWAEPELMSELREFFSEACCNELEGGLGRDKEAQKQIKLAYDALFSVPIKGKCVTPYESVYREDYMIDGKPKKLLMGKSAQAIMQFVFSAGMEIPMEAKELPDHVGMELLLMAGMCTQENIAWDRNNTDEAQTWLECQRNFIKNHLSEWILPLSADIRERSSNHFIRALATMMVELINNDLEYLEHIKQ